LLSTESNLRRVKEDGSEEIKGSGFRTGVDLPALR
jgi:hypothetical protein